MEKSKFMSKLRIGTDCSGIGSPETALKNLNIPHETIFACDIDKWVKKSYIALHGEPQTWYDDLTKRKHIDVPPLDLYVAGFPCQSFSIAGNRNGFDDVRGSVFFHVAEFIKENRPKVFILENVDNIVGHDNGKTMKTILDVLSGNGTCNNQYSIPYYDDGLDYHIHHAVIRADHHGIPQKRTRWFVVGFSEPRKFDFPCGQELTTKMSDYLEKESEIDPKFWVKKSTVEYIAHNTRGEYKFTVNRDVANTITCMVSKMQRSSQDNYIMPSQNGQMTFARTADHDDRVRRLTPRECWRLQGFTDEQYDVCEEQNSHLQLYRQAGNSIAVPVIQNIINKIF